MNLPKYYLLFLLSCLQVPIFAQLGPHSASIKWQQINTKKVRVIFPEDFDHQGLRVANLINYMEQNSKRSIGPLSQKIEIVLHNQTTIPNGFVGIAPFRSEFFATPPQSANFLGTVDWVDALTIHEYRHALQFSNAKVGLTKLLAILQGDNGWGLASGTSIPNWFWEGDATIMETALTKGGRGRAPFFTLEQRATLLNGKNYNYQKARNRSFKDLVPNHYRLGYAMLMHNREKYGNDFWQPIFDNAARYKPLIYPFSNALKRATGLKTKDLYKETYQSLKEKWTTQLTEANLIPTNPIAIPPKKTVTNYRFPFPLKDGSIVCLKSSYKQTDALIQLKDGKEKKLTNIGFHLEKYLSVTGQKAVWTEYEQDPRRNNTNYSNIVSYDFKTKEKVRLTTESRYFSPNFSHSAGRIVTVKVTSNQKNSLIILNANTGQMLKMLPNPANHFISFPKWAENDTDIIYVAKHNSQLAIFKYNLISNQTTQLTDWTHHTIADLHVKNKTIYFTASFSGIDNIYSIDITKNAKITQLTSVKIGSFFPALSLDNQQLVFSEFTDMGYTLSSQNIGNQRNAQSIKIVAPHLQSFYSAINNAEEGGDILGTVPNETYPIKRYKGFFKGMRLHSWNFTPSLSLPTLDIQIDNYLNDFSFNIIGGYNVNEKSAVAVTSATYGKWYPQLTLFTSLTNRNALFLTQQDSAKTQQFDQFSVGGQVSIPLTWIRDNYGTSLRTFGGYIQRYLSDTQFGDIPQPNKSIGTIQLGINVSNLRRTAFQNLGPRWGQAFNLLYQQTTDTRTDRQVRVGGELYFPGIGANHNLKLGIGYQRELLKNTYQFSDGFEYPRGFGSIGNDEFLRLSADYQLPLAYPDWGLWGISYFKRISANLFFDYGRRKLETLDVTDNHNSVGIELIFDNNFWNELPVTFGVRNSYLLTRDSEQYQFEFFVRNFLIP
ncbi:MAG: TolB family protein [Saprospiraceae bacterium]